MKWLDAERTPETWGPPMDLPVAFLPAFLRYRRLGGNRPGYIGDEQVGVPVETFERRGLRMLRILHPPIARGERLASADEKDVLHELVRTVQRDRLAHRIVQPPTTAVFHAVPDGAVACRFGTPYLDLADVSEDDLFLGLHAKHRNVIRKARRAGATVRFGSSLLDDVHALYARTMARSDLGFDARSRFDDLHDELGDGALLCGVVYVGDEPQGALAVPFTRYAAYYVFGGSSDRVSVTGAVNLLHWEAIVRLKSLGVRRYDFVGMRLSSVAGTKMEGIQRFKLRFGSQVDEGFLWKLDVRRGACRAFDALSRVRQGLRGGAKTGDLIDQEREKQLDAS